MLNLFNSFIMFKIMNITFYLLNKSTINEVLYPIIRIIMFNVSLY
jgi:hypothetical protein